MGRPREHDEQTREALIAAAERLLAAGGLDALSVRAVAAEAGTTTRAVYSVFGDKEGLLEALAEQAFRVLGEGLDGVPVTDDPVADVIACGAGMYRRFVTEHPWLFRIAFQRVARQLRFGEGAATARQRTWVKLEARFARLTEAGLLDGKPVTDAAVEFNALCEGLGNAELRGGTLRVVPEGEEARVWQDAFASLMRGLTGDRVQAHE